MAVLLFESTKFGSGALFGKIMDLRLIKKVGGCFLLFPAPGGGSNPADRKWSIPCMLIILTSNILPGSAQDPKIYLL